MASLHGCKFKLTAIQICYKYLNNLFLRLITIVKLTEAVQKNTTHYPGIHFWVAGNGMAAHSNSRCTKLDYTKSYRQAVKRFRNKS